MGKFVLIMVFSVTCILSFMLVLYVPFLIRQNKLKLRGNRKYSDQIEENIRKLESETLGYIWQDHRRKVREYKKTHNVHDETLSVILVEGRKHQLLKPCLENLHQHLPNWKLHVVHGLQNEEFVKDIVDKLPCEVKLTRLNKHNLKVTEFSLLIGTQHFWKNIADTDRVLLTQTDAWVCHDSKYKIEEFFVYDYVGAPWIRYNKSEPSRKETYIVGNCGFCLCRREAMIDTVMGYPYKYFIRDTGTQAVDIYFSTYIKNVAPPMIAKAFSVEHIWYDRPVGVHKPFYMDPEKLSKLELHCEGVMALEQY